MKNSIKEVMGMGGKISLPYKSEIDDWYGEIEIIPSEDISTGIKTFVVKPMHTEFFHSSDAIDFFMHHAVGPGNIGMIQKRLRKKGLLSESEHDLEHPSIETKALFEKEKELVEVEACWEHIMKPHTARWWQPIKEYNRIKSDESYYVQVEFWQSEGSRLVREYQNLEQKYRDKVMKIERPFWPEHIRDIMDEQGY